MKFKGTKNSWLKVVSLGGWGKVNQNMFVYESANDIIVVDCGVDFPDDTESEVEVIIPNIDYLKERKNKIRGIIISHGHLDHFGALPFILPAIGNPPVFATRLAEGFIQSRMSEFNITRPRTKVITPDDGVINLGAFKVTPFGVNHSVPESLGLCLETPVGKIFHVSDFKFDMTPVEGRVFQIGKAARLAYPHVLALFSDCLGAVNEGYTGSEREIENIFDQIVEKTKRQVFITSVSSNISRFQQAIRVSLEHGRKIVILGRSVEEKIRVAQKLGYLKIKEKNIIPLKKAKKLPQKELTYLIAGSYGQTNSALSRLADDEYRNVKLEEGAVVIFSADPSPPGSKKAVDALVDKLTLRGAEVHYYEIQENLHVSGHGSAGDIRLLFTLVKPKYFVPIGGDPRHVRAGSLLAKEMGAPEEQVLELFDGEVIQFSENQARIVDRMTIKGVPIKSQ